MNETINKFLLAGDKFMSEMHLSSQLRLVNQGLEIVSVDRLLKTQNIMEISVDLLQWYIHFSIKSLQVVLSKGKIC